MGAHKNIIVGAERLRELYWECKLSLRQIGVRCGLSKRSVAYQMNKAGIPVRDNKVASRMWNKTHPLTEVIKNKLSEAHTHQVELTIDRPFAYLLGVILGDGCWYGRRGSYYRIQIAPGLDEAFADECVFLLRQIGLHPRKDLKLPKKPQHNPQWLVEVSSKALYDFLKSVTLEKLKQLLSTKQLRLAFWRGFAKAEGWQTPSELQISNANGGLLEWGKQFMVELGLRPHLYQINYKKDHKKPTYSLRLHGNDQVACFLTSPEVGYKIRSVEVEK